MTLGRRAEPTLLTLGWCGRGGSGAPLAKLRAPAWAAVFSNPSRTVDLAQAAAHWHSGELNTVARFSIFVDQNSP
jgi:hypothetical protein